MNDKIKTKLRAAIQLYTGMSVKDFEVHEDAETGAYAMMASFDDDGKGVQFLLPANLLTKGVLKSSLEDVSACIEDVEFTSWPPSQGKTTLTGTF
jgi:hypothetical protein